MRIYLRRTKREYVGLNNGELCVFNGYSFSIDKKFYGFVTQKDGKWIAYSIYDGRILSYGDTRREAVNSASTKIQQNWDSIIDYLKRVKEQTKSPRGINTRALKI